MNRIDEIINGDIDLYKFLELKTTATNSEIKRQYRRKALIYHPDKNKGDVESKVKFDLLLTSYEILIDENLRNQYDKIRQDLVNKREKLQESNEKRQNFKDELLKGEFESKLKNSDKSGIINYDDLVKSYHDIVKRDQLIERLREEGIRLRREMESKLLEQNSNSSKKIKKDYISYEDIKIPRYHTFINQTNPPTTSSMGNTVLVKWKHKPELKGMINEEVLNKIMGIFGPIKKIQLQHRQKQTSSKYDEAIIEYDNQDGVIKATNHDYKKSAKLWDGTSVRKLASLLRECEIWKSVNDDEGNINDNALNNALNELITKL